MQRFRIISRLGAGGFGEAFRAWDTQRGVPVVLKRPLKKYLQRTDVLARFDREINRLLELSHPRIVPIIDHGRDADGCPYLAMRFLPAGSLADRKKRHPLTFLHRWLPSVAEALDYVHARGVVHRDVKPANIFFDADSQAYLGDFGIAKVIDEEFAQKSEQSLTSTGGEIGTYPYMGPEFFRSPRVLSSAYDQYALAITVYEMICGRRPFSGDSGQLVVAHVTQVPPDVRRFSPDAPASLCDAIMRALEKNPATRFRTCGEFAEAILLEVPGAKVDHSYQRFLCPGCQKLVRVPMDFGGRSCRCPDCDALLRVSRHRDALWLQGEALATSAEARSQPRSLPQTLVRNSIGMNFCLIKPGTFMMGFSGDEPAEKPAHEVCISRPFYLGQTAVTQRQWMQVMGTVSGVVFEDTPAVGISWEAAVFFCKKLSAMSDERAAARAYRLPTEAEWEYACRAGTTTRYSFGDDAALLTDCGWFANNSGTTLLDAHVTDLNPFAIGCRIHAVAEKKPNPWGLYDMHGNVSEWCSDWYGNYPTGASHDPQGPKSGDDKVSRGGSWFSIASRCCSTSRQHQHPSMRLPMLGFRVVLISLPGDS